MRVERWLGLVAFLALVAIGLVQLGCNAESDALNLFSHNRLNLLRPARDYIQPGGMVFVPKNGSPEYDDPKDNVVPEKGNLTDFRASILQETANKKTGLGAALSLAATVIPMPINAGFQSSKDVSLKQIDTTGLRLNTNDLDKLIAAPNTSQAAAAELRRGTRVFVVQEIYKATSLDLSAADNVAFNLNFNDGKAVADCKQTQPSDKTSGDNTPDKKASPPQTNGKGSTGSSGNTNAGKAGATAGKGQSGSSPSPSPVNAQSKLGAGIAFCVAEGFTLKLQTKDPIPFAVRLAELELSQGILRRKRGHVLSGTLGNAEISADLVDENKPALNELTRRSSATR